MEAVFEKPKIKKKKKTIPETELQTSVTQITQVQNPQVSNIDSAQDASEILTPANEVESDNDICSNTVANEKDEDIERAKEAPLTHSCSEPEAETSSNKLETTNCDTVEASPQIERLLNINKEILSTIKISDVQTIQSFPTKTVEKSSHESNKEISIKPYTEQQLSALYYNSELDLLDEFSSQFVEAELKGLAVKQHPLFELLLNYLRVREKLTGNILELDQTRKEYQSLQGDLWTMEIASVTGRAECQDGQIVTANHNFNKSIFHRSIFQSIIRSLSNIQKLIHENHVLYSYTSEDLKFQIELYIQSVISNCLAVTQLTKDHPVSLTLQAEPQHLKPYISEVRLSISILFSFQRRLIRDQEFLKQTRNWLQQLVAVLLRLASYQDHLFILNHVLRCPPGVGSWASSFIQLPIQKTKVQESPFSSYEINHILAVLATILNTVTERDKFLKDIAQNQDTATDALWIVIDSEGEEDEENSGISLKENDLVAILNQLPLDELFRSVLLIKNKDFQDSYDVSLVTEHHLLRCLAFSTVLLRIFHNGLKAYNLSRYNQFSKRLSRFIRHVVQYITDQWEEFLRVQKLEDQSMLQRLQIEYDAFFLRAIYYLYSSQKVGAWQFLAVVPYNMVTLKTLWKIFYFLHSSDHLAQDILNPLDEEDYDKKLWSDELRIQFEEKLDKLDNAEVYYLLNTFANMGLARDNKDMDFIYHCTMDLLQVSFISSTTQEICSKPGRNLLTHITSKHSHLLSNILKKVKEHIETIGELALYLYEDLPLSIWHLCIEDFELISRLLLNNKTTTTESKLARMILSRLNWDIIPYEMHCNVAILVVQAVDQEPAYLNWGWQTILRLKLHISDQHFTELGRIESAERNAVLMKGIREEQTLASFVALLMTDWGHFVPLIGSRGLPELLFLQKYHKHEAVLFVLYQLVPLFINSQESIINCEQFLQILTNILNADRGYISIAKSFLTTSDTVVQQLGNMIETQIVNFAAYGQESPRCLVRLWVNSLVSVPNWNRDTGVLYLLDGIIRTAFFHKDALEVVYNILRDIYQCSSSQESSGSLSSLIKWVSNSTSNNSLIVNSLASYSWLAYILIEIEFQEKEVKTGVWREILLQLSKQKGKINVDLAIKKAAGITKSSVFTSGCLCIFRWAQQALDAPLDHPILCLLWQKFFTLYLARLPTSSVADKPCVGERFFDGLVNFRVFKSIKKRLQESIQFYQSKLEDIAKDETPDQSRNHFYESSSRIFQAFLLWLEEPRLQENILIPSLPPQYESKLLSFIIQGSETPWYEYLDYESIKEQQARSVKIWKVANFREKKNINKPLPNPGKSIESSDPTERILRRLGSYDAPKPAPDIVVSAPVVPNINFNNKENMFASLEQCFKTLKQFAHNHILKLSEHKALDCSYQELVPQLYRSVLNKVKKKVPCKGRNQSIHCSGAAVVVLEMQEARINERIDQQIQTNRNAYESLVDKSLQSPALSLCTASVILHQSIRLLQSQLKCNPATAELGVELFYYILSLINEETLLYLPTKTLFATCLEKLGQSHICGVEQEMPGLLQKILFEPALGGYLAPHFSPAQVGTANMLLMYSTICKEVGQKYDITFALLSKFEIENWLNNKEPKLSQRSQFIQVVIKALAAFGIDPPMESLMLHGLYRKHLLTVFEYQFPEHYGEILMLLLKASNGNPETNLVSLSVWLDVLNSLSKPVYINLKSSLRDQLRQYAQYQKMLHHQELLETADMLSKHFTQERLQYGLYGLYPKCRNYMDIYATLLGMTGHGIIISMLNTHQGLLGDKMCEKIWPYLRDMFAPWLVPYSMQNLKENMASWIQQLADDRSVLLPWIPADVGYAQKILNVFYECILFIMHTLPASTSILSYMWQWYVTCFAHTSVKDHVLIPIHQVFSAFPWQNFWPSVVDLDLMLRVVDLYLPECHSFLGHIFMSIPWANWINNFTNTSPQIKSRVYHCFLHILVKLANEPNVKKNYAEKAKSLLVQAEGFDWVILDSVVYQHVMDWFVMSYDPAIIFKSDLLDLDYRVLQFLKTVAGYNNTTANDSSSALNKKLIWIKANVKLLSVYSSRYKNNIPSKNNDIFILVSRHFDDLEKTATKQDEMDSLLKELLSALNISNISPTVLKAFVKWIEHKPGDSMVVKSLLKGIGITVTDFEILSDLLEVTLMSYFTNVVSERDSFNPKWDEVRELVNVLVAKQTILENVLLDRSAILTLNAVLLKRMSRTLDRELLMNLCLEWMTKIKMSDSIEPKIPLLWFNLLTLAQVHSNNPECVPVTGAILYKFSQILLQFSEDKGNSSWSRGILSAIGISKPGSISLNFRFVCKALAGYILAQLPEMKGEPQMIRTEPNAPNKVGQPGGNSECAKVLLGLDFGQSQGKIKECAELALKQIQDPKNSLHNIKSFLLLLVRQFYMNPFLKDSG